MSICWVFEFIQTWVFGEENWDRVLNQPSRGYTRWKCHGCVSGNVRLLQDWSAQKWGMAPSVSPNPWFDPDPSPQSQARTGECVHAANPCDHGQHHDPQSACELRICQRMARMCRDHHAHPQPRWNLQTPIPHIIRYYKHQQNLGFRKGSTDSWEHLLQGTLMTCQGDQ